MSYVKIWVHAVWGTKNREPILSKEIRNDFFKHLKDNAKKKEIFIDTVNGHLEHVHCLLTLNADLSIAKTMQLIKGESANWANKSGLFPNHFSWADEYFAVSVSESQVEKVRRYIINQEEHHRKVSFNEEYNTFIKKYGFPSQG
jgi:putative transposase